MNRFGHNFRLSLFGESHGPALGVVIDGTPAGLPLSVADFEPDLSRRRAGTSGTPGTTPRREPDTPEIVSGLFNGHTTGAPLAIMFRNTDARPGDYAALASHPRPSHADLVAAQKFGGANDPRGGGHFSGRLTLPLVAAGVVAKKILGLGIKLSSDIIEIGGSRDPRAFDRIIAAAQKDGDSVGGVIEVRARGVPTGLGEPFFDSVESVAAHLLFSIPGIKGVEFGSGFAGARLRGSEHNDPIVDSRGTTSSNHAGGIVGGITNGNDIVLRVAVKPTSSIARAQQTWNFATGRLAPLTIPGRHDTCIALRAPVILEAALAITLADLLLT
jgi:chorismate synthase